MSTRLLRSHPLAPVLQRLLGPFPLDEHLDFVGGSLHLDPTVFGPFLLLLWSSRPLLSYSLLRTPQCVGLWNFIPGGTPLLLVLFVVLFFIAVSSAPVPLVTQRSLPALPWRLVT